MRFTRLMITVLCLTLLCFSSLADGAPGVPAKVTLVAWPDVPVQIVTLGSIVSRVVVGGEETDVYTRELSFGKDMIAGKSVAMVNATRTGQCTMHNKRSIKFETVMRKIPCGTIIGVAKAGAKWSRVVYKGEEGYVLTAALRFLNTSAQPIGTGVVSLNGRATGNTTVNVRGGPHSGSRIVDEWKTASTVLIWSKSKSFWEVEFNGRRAWIQEKFLTTETVVEANAKAR